MLERNYEAFINNKKWYIEYEYYSFMNEQWERTLFRSDIDNTLLYFYSEEDANNWIKTREKIINTEL